MGCTFRSADFKPQPADFMVRRYESFRLRREALSYSKETNAKTAAIAPRIECGYLMPCSRIFLAIQELSFTSPQSDRPNNPSTLAKKP